ncbi:hypothetical protein B0H14DRAFT_2559146 [Mycena olivaceomarginata]|nr:hypothetical protein B0H14DRAFT_2559146 [Mycena olivaceomarginata]
MMHYYLDSKRALGAAADPLLLGCTSTLTDNGFTADVPNPHANFLCVIRLGVDRSVDSENTPSLPDPAGRKGACRKASRVTHAIFSPLSARLANFGKFAVRVNIATEDGFPADHVGFSWKSVSDAVASSAATALADRLAMAEKSEERRAQLINYLRGDVKTLCNAAVDLYGIAGNFTQNEIVEHVKFLTGKMGIFKYRGIDLEPFGVPFYSVVMRKQWFDSLKSLGGYARKDELTYLEGRRLDRGKRDDNHRANLNFAGYHEWADLKPLFCLRSGHPL